MRRPRAQIHCRCEAASSFIICVLAGILSAWSVTLSSPLRLCRCSSVLLVTLWSVHTAFPQESPASLLDQRAILQFLNQTVSWYQRLAVERQMATTPGDMLFASDNRPVADQVVRLTFEFARNGGQLLNKNATASATQAASDGGYQRMSQAASMLDNQINQTRTELDSLRKKLEKATSRERKAVESSIAETQSELALLEARRDILQTMLQFIGGAAEPGGLNSQIEALQRSVPRVESGGQTTTGVPNNPAPESLTASAIARFQPAGIWDILRELLALSRKLDVIDEDIRQTDELKQNLNKIQTPLGDHVKAMVRQSDSILKEPDSQDPAVLAQQKSTLDALTAQFKLISSTLVPLGEAAILLNIYGKNLSNWQAAVKSEYSTNLKGLLLRLLALGVLLGLVLGAFELWRQAIFRYVPDLRRRYQFLLLRRIALWFVITLVVAFGLVSELGSLATFAGLMTAGVAVALQNVILAVVGYFLLIGKYGVRVGDRVQVSGVSGEVVEIGLIRLHVMELVGTGADAQPTGRVVAFSNSIVFQPTACLFKQAPGTSFVWHEITMTLVVDIDYRTVEGRILAAVNVAFQNYQKDFETLRHQIERSLTSITVGSMEPKVRFRLTSAGLEVLIRFPVELQKSAEIDDRVTRELLRAIEEEPKLKVVGAEVPTIRLKTESPANASPA